MSPFSDFQCHSCGNCCRWSGCVKLLEHETEAIAAFLRLPEVEFLSRFTRLAPDRRFLSLTEKADGSCVFLDEHPVRCRIQAVKPAQCRDFPARWNFPGWERECAGANVRREA